MSLVEVEIHGSLPATGPRARALVLKEARVAMDRAVNVAEHEVESRGPAGVADLFPDVDFSGDELVGTATVTDFRFWFFEVGTGVEFTGKGGSGTSGGRGKAFGPRKAGPSQRNPKHPRALKTPRGFRAKVRGVKARHMLQEGRRAALPLVLAEFERNRGRVVDRLERS